VHPRNVLRNIRAECALAVTVGELIEKLRELPQDLKVVSRGYRGWGYNDPKEPVVVNVTAYAAAATQYTPDYYPSEESADSLKALAIIGD